MYSAMSRSFWTIRPASQKKGPVGADSAAERPAHAPFVRLQLREWRARHRPEHHVMVGQVNLEAIEPVRHRRAGRTGGGESGPNMRW